jgi:hypothetical protein
MENTIEIIKSLIEKESDSIKPTLTNKYEFERNIIGDYKCFWLTKRLEFIEKHFNYIGKEVFKYEKSFSYTSIEDFENKKNNDISHDIFNPINKKSIIFSDDMFKLFLKEYLNFQVIRLCDEIINRPFLNSTNAFSNLEHQFIVKAKRDLIDFLKDINKN